MYIRPALDVQLLPALPASWFQQEVEAGAVSLHIKPDIAHGRMQDLLAHLRPSLERLTSFEQAAQAVAAIETSETRSVAAGPAGLGAIEEEDSDSDDSAGNSGSDSDNEGIVHSHQCTDPVASACQVINKSTNNQEHVNTLHLLHDDMHSFQPVPWSKTPYS